MADYPHAQFPEEASPAPAETPPGLSNSTGEPSQSVVVAKALDDKGPPVSRIWVPAAEPSSSPLKCDRPVRWREIAAVIFLVALADVTLYRGQGFAGVSLWFVAAPLLLALGAPRPNGRAGSWILGAMLLVLAVKLVWCGSDPLAVVGFALLVALATSLAGLEPYAFDVAIYALQTPVAGCLGLAEYYRSSDRLGRGAPRGGWLTLLLPLVALAAFGTIFVLANPDLVISFRETIRRMFDSLRDWLVRFGPSWKEVLFWLVVGWAAVGLLRPVMRRSVLARFMIASSNSPERDTPADAPLYAAVRNMLAAVIVLFAVYLVFEFKTLWFRTFPKGFYYAGYAHEGAAWLTLALALATGLLSLVFRGRVLCDPRLPRLRRLAWIWSALNMLLALAVYNRLFIYIDFNGMTRMRTIGLVGMTAVVVGFVLVIWRIVHQRDFLWLLNRHLWTLAIAVYLLAVLPVDMLVHRYNVWRVLAGDLAPSVQISVHPISSEGILVLPPLAHCDNAVIRKGICAMLAERAEKLEASAQQRRQQGWTSFQLADQVLLDRLRAIRSDWQAYNDRAKRTVALEQFHNYAYQWY